jgi:hypothetical protein
MAKEIDKLIERTRVRIETIETSIQLEANSRLRTKFLKELKEVNLFVLNFLKNIKGEKKNESIQRW